MSKGVNFGNFLPFSQCFQLLNPLPDNKILDWSKLKQIEDDIFKCDENSRKFSKRVDNTVGKEEIAHYEQFLLFLQCFQKACFLEVSKGVIAWEWLNKQIETISLPLIFSQITNFRLFQTPLGAQEYGNSTTTGPPVSG